MSPTLTEDKNEALRRMVREGYAKIAEDTSSGCCGPGVSCCGSAPPDAVKLARELGYSVEELKSLPDGANMGLSCGNPAALAALKPGEVVLDLGSGGGFDVFIAGRKVGPKGRAIGVDMTPEMLAKARRNTASYRKETGLDNVEFRLGEIEHLPVADNSVDAIISNCVINLSPAKPQVWREMARVLKPGGRVAVSDVALLKPLPPEVLKLVEALVGCIAGAALVSDTGRMAREAGLTDIVLTKKSDFIKAKADWNDPLYRKIVEHLPAGTKSADFITSLEVQARKTDKSKKNTEVPMKRLEIYDPAMCCSTGVCGPDVDTKLVQFAADLDWLKTQDVIVQRHNLSQNPAAFVENEAVKTALAKKGEAALPLLLVNGKVTATGRYPERGELVVWFKLKATATPVPAKSSCCCGGSC
jgi:SAM-dependent methyltransferase